MENNTDNCAKLAKTPHHGENIKRFRGLRGIKQEVLAEMLGKSGSWIYELERKAVVADSDLQLIADALQVHIDVLKNYTDDCDFQINVNGDNVGGAMGYGYMPKAESEYIENDVKEIAAALKPLYEEINEKNIEIYKLKEELKSLKAKN